MLHYESQNLIFVDGVVNNSIYSYYFVERIQCPKSCRRNYQKLDFQNVPQLDFISRVLASCLLWSSLALQAS